MTSRTSVTACQHYTAGADGHSRPVRCERPATHCVASPAGYTWDYMYRYCEEHGGARVATLPYPAALAPIPPEELRRIEARAALSPDPAEDLPDDTLDTLDRLAIEVQGVPGDRYTLSDWGCEPFGTYIAPVIVRAALAADAACDLGATLDQQAENFRENLTPTGDDA